MGSSKGISLKKNFFYSAAYQILLIIVPLITAPYVTRALTSEPLGQYSYVHSIANYFMILTTLGLSLSGSRRVAATKDDEKERDISFSSNYIVQLSVSILIIAAYLIWCVVAKLSSIYWIMTLMVLSGMFDISWLYRGLEDFKTSTLVSGIAKVVTTIFIFLFVKKPTDILLYTIIMSLGMLLPNVFLLLLIKGRVQLVKVKLKEILFAFKEAIVFFIPVISVTLYRSMDKIMIGSLLGDMQGVSNYSYAEQILNIPMGIITALSSVILPRMTNLYANKSDETEGIIEKTMLFTGFLSCAVSFGIAGISSVFVPLYLGNEYIACGEYVIYLSITVIFISWTTMIRSQYLIPQKKDRIYVVAVVSGAVINLVINAILIPLIGIEGAIIGTIVAESTVMVIQTLAARKGLNIKKYILNNVPFLVLGIVMFLVCRLLANVSSSSVLTITIQIVVGGLIYIVGSFIYMYKCHNNILKILLKRK